MIVLDLGLPDLDGSHLLEVACAEPDPVIVATARDDEGEMVRLLGAGADDYLVKPFRSRSWTPGSEPSSGARRKPGRTARSSRRPAGGPRTRQATLDGVALDFTRGVRPASLL